MVNRPRWVPPSHFRLSHKDHQRPSHQLAPPHRVNPPPALLAAAKLPSVPIATRPFQWAQGNVSRVEQLSSPIHRYESLRTKPDPKSGSIFEDAGPAPMLPVTVTISVTNREISKIICSRDTKQFFWKSFPRESSLRSSSQPIPTPRQLENG